mgnify:CR=1 FL=1
MILIGKPTHLANGRITACGIFANDKSYDPRDVDCVRCRKTKKFKYLMNGKSNKGD